MGLSAGWREKGLWMIPLLVALWVMVGCAEIKPYKPYNHREEGPQEGLFTGSEGDWVIFRKGKAPPDGDAQKTGRKEDPDKSKDDK